MEGKRFLIIIADEKERANVKEICMTRTGIVVCVSSIEKAKPYFSSLTGYHRVIIDLDLPNDDVAVLCKDIKKVSPETFIIGLRTHKREPQPIFDVQVFKPLFGHVLDFVLKGRLI